MKNDVYFKVIVVVASPYTNGVAATFTFDFFLFVVDIKSIFPTRIHTDALGRVKRTLVIFSK